MVEGAVFSEWQTGVVDGHLDQPGTPTVGARCLTTRRIGGTDRPAGSEFVHIDPPRIWGVRGIDGPIRATVVLAVEALTETRSRVTPSPSSSRGTRSARSPRRPARGRREMPTNLATLKQRLESG